MNMRTKLFIGILVVAVSVALSFLVILNYMRVESLLGLFGVVIGALVSEFSHHQVAREERRHQLRLAALDRRLQAHQEAFSLWRQILKDIDDRARITQTVADCQEWWNNNCLYLTEDARQAFVQAYLLAHARNEILSSGGSVTVRDFEMIKRAGDLIVQGVELPTISEGEAKQVSPIPKK